jgi:hypothetical protein
LILKKKKKALASFPPSVQLKKQVKVNFQMPITTPQKKLPFLNHEQRKPGFWAYVLGVREEVMVGQNQEGLNQQAFQALP